MIIGPILIDTNILMLLVVGSTNRNMVDSHKNIRNQFTIDDFDLLSETIGERPDLILLPNVITETSNLLAQTGEPNRGKLLSTLRHATVLYKEVYIRSGIAVRHPAFERLGLTDCALLSTEDMRFHLLTVDFNLYRLFLSARRPVTNFRHVIDSRL